MTSQGVIRETDAEALRLGRTLMRTARYGALATLAAGGGPQVTRVGVSTDADGTPLILISALAAHTPALKADPACGLLLGHPGKGDPLAHPRLSLTCRARFLEPGSPDAERAAGRYLAHQEKAALYAGLPDFAYVRLEIVTASLNAGFGRAYAPTATELLLAGPAVAEIAAVEPDAITHMNADHADAVGLIARHFAGGAESNWRLTGIDPEGIDLAAGDEVRRIFFDAPLASADDVRPALVEMTRTARTALG